MVTQRFLLIACSLFAISGCERVLVTASPSTSALLDVSASSAGAITLASDVRFPTYPECCYNNGQVSFHEAINVPRGEYNIEIRVEGTLRYLSGSHVEEFGPGGAIGSPSTWWNQPGDRGVFVHWYPRIGGLRAYRAEPPGPNPVYTFNFKVRGPGYLELSRTHYYPAYGTLTGEQRFTVRAIPVSQGSVRLSCSGDLGLNRVTRGKELVCRASKDPPDATGELTVTRWSFNGTPRSDGDAQSLEWRGIMVQGGTVEVRGRIGTGPEQTATASIEVVDRTWPEIPVMSRLELGATGGDDRVPLLPPEIKVASDLGAFSPLDAPPLGEQVEDPIADISGGPNDGLYYFEDLSFRLWGYIRINDAAMTAGSRFYNAQEPNTTGGGTQIGGAPWCTRRVVTTVLPPLVRAHEQRHAEVYRERYAEVVRAVLPDLERMAGSYSELADRYERLRREADDEAHDASWAIHDLRGNPNVVTPSESGRECNLKNDEGQLLRNPPKQEDKS